MFEKRRKDQEPLGEKRLCRKLEDHTVNRDRCESITLSSPSITKVSSVVQKIDTSSRKECVVPRTAPSVRIERVANEGHTANQTLCNCIMNTMRYERAKVDKLGGKVYVE